MEISVNITKICQNSPTLEKKDKGLENISLADLFLYTFPA